jgi:hypothetical protein
MLFLRAGIAGEVLRSWRRAFEVNLVVKIPDWAIEDRSHLGKE